MTLFCVSPGCFIPRSHTKACEQSSVECRGCVPAEATIGRVCERDFNHVTYVLAGIDELTERLAAGYPEAVDGRLALEHIATDADGQLVQWGESTGRLRDPVAASVPAGNVTRLAAPRVSGTPGRSAPVPLDVVDLLAPSRLGSVNAARTHAFDTDYRVQPLRVGVLRRCRCGWPGVDVEAHRGVAGRSRPDEWREWRDQIGHISAATLLDLWAHYWHDYGAGTLPNPTVPDLTRWLTARWEWAARNQPVIVEFIAETRQLRSRLFGVLHEREPEPEEILGVACRSCRERNLWRRVDGTATVDCHSCGLILKADEFADYTRRLLRWSKPLHDEAWQLARAQHDERGGLCPICNRPTLIDDVHLANTAGVIRVVFNCRTDPRCEALMTPAVA